MHTMWKGSISFGLVSVPVRMYAATESKDVKFRYLHKICKTPIQYTRTCPHCNRAVEWDEIVRGVEYQPNQFVILEADELEAVTRQRSQTIDIIDFVQLSDIDPVYFDKTYYLAPEASGLKAYRLLAAAMAKTQRIAIAKTVLRTAETLACVRVHDGVVLMETLFWPDEVRPTAELPNIHADAAVTENELNMAITLIEQLATRFDPETYVDERRTALLELIQRKVANEEIETSAPTARTDNIVDLMKALEESIRLTKPTAAKPKAATRKRSS